MRITVQKHCFRDRAWFKLNRMLELHFLRLHKTGNYISFVTAILPKKDTKKKTISILGSLENVKLEVAFIRLEISNSDSKYALCCRVLS